jgi:CheY-like chemotaxis protein
MDTDYWALGVQTVVCACVRHAACDSMKTPGAPIRRPAGSVDRKAKDPLQPVRILVAEDSFESRLLLQIYLKDSPYEATFEEDGKAAVERFASSEFDLILMDVQMPILDGLAASRAIRAIERERGSASVPILALTANDSVQDIERSVEAGCDDHLSKPISKLELLRAIQKYGEQTVEMTQSGSPVSVRIEIPEGFETLIHEYLAFRKKEIPELISLLEASNFKRLGTLGHNIKGNAECYGFPDVAKLGAALEQSAKQMDDVTLRAQITELGEYLDRVQLVAKV